MWGMRLRVSPAKWETVPLNVLHLTIMISFLVWTCILFVVVAVVVCLTFYSCIVPTPQWGAADAEVKVPSGENTELDRSPFKAWSRSVYSHTCYACCHEFLPCLCLLNRSIHLHFFQASPDFFLRWPWLTPVPLKAHRIK